MSETKTISLDGNDELFWEDVEKYSKNHGFKTTSGYIQYLLERDIFGLKTKFKDIINYVVLLGVIMMVILILLLLVR